MCFSRKTTKCTGKHRDILQTFDKTIHITEILPTTVFIQINIAIIHILWLPN